MKLHNDWPEVVATRDDESYYMYPDPYSDVAQALGEAGAPYTLLDLGAVNRYHITSTSGDWAPDNPEVGTELYLVLVGTLRDGRWFGLEAGNDYTGWGCMGDAADFYVGDTEDDVIRNGLTQEARGALGVSL